MPFKAIHLRRTKTILLLSIILLFSPYPFTIGKPTKPRHKQTLNSNSKISETKEPKSVIELNSRNFDKTIRNGGKVWLVEFYAPWCSHCKQFAPRYALMSVDLDRNYDYDITLAKVDGSSERALSSRFNVHGYPTFFVIEGWSVWHYQGARDQNEMIKFVTEGYKDQEPMPFIYSPYGPLGISRTWLMNIGNKILDIHEFLVAKGLSTLLAAGLMMVFGFFSFVIGIIVVGVTISIKLKKD